MSLRAANRLKHIKIDVAASGDLVAAPSGSTVGQKIRVTSYVLVAAGAVTAKFQSGGSRPHRRDVAHHGRPARGAGHPGGAGARGRLRTRS
jgi:hypothetical protein